MTSPQGDMLHTARLDLEVLNPTHAGLLFDGLCDEQLYEFIDDEPPASLEVLRERYARLARHSLAEGAEIWLNWALRVRADNRYVGFVQATIDSRKQADFAYVLFREFWGRGYAREAVAAMISHLAAAYHVHRVRALVDPRNERSVKLLESLQFVCVAHHVGTARIRGEVVDDLEFLLEVPFPSVN